MVKIANLIPKKIIPYLKRTDYFYFKYGENKVAAPKQARKKFIIIDNYEKYLKFINIYCISEKSDHKKRFIDGSKMLILADATSILCSEWLISNIQNFKIDYNKTNLKIGKTVFIFFNFETPENHRRNGYYQTLLVETINAFDGYDFLIYTSPSNIGSRSGILGSGFKKLGTYRTIRNRGLFKKIKLLNIDIKKV